MKHAFDDVYIRSLGNDKIDYVQAAIRAEVDRARKKHPKSFNSFHEGYAVILEEMDELWDEVKRKDVDLNKMRTKALQVAAMAVRFLVELT